ncbi:dihydroneopterin aldolase [Stigmatella aurantiaca]|uniref:Dihydroneopterin aldolase n=1 Tax=Stigmatella aurantiaca TaxID=41 RepID=A0A1H7VAR8_STIAU|nr:dihydroneopterin aldolase [Stigmatella aurantiaca]SEM06038.1 dihydroneopterin aldolase [Stigmatella aurantiaca]
MNEPLRLPVETDGQGRLLDVIELRDFTVQSALGTASAGGEAARWSLEVALFLDTRRAATDGHLSHTVHYGRLAGELRFLLESCRFESLEPVAEAVVRYVLLPPSLDAPHAQVRAATVRVTRPEAPGGQAVPAVQVHRRHGHFAYPVEETPSGHVDRIYEGPRYNICRLRIRPGGFVSEPRHPRMAQSQLVLGGGLLLQGRPAQQGMVFHGLQGLTHRYDNPTGIEQSVLCVEQPKVVEADAALVQGRSYYPAEDPHLS